MKHNGEDSQLLVESKTKRKDTEVEDDSPKIEQSKVIKIPEKNVDKEEVDSEIKDEKKTENNSDEVKDE